MRFLLAPEDSYRLVGAALALAVMVLWAVHQGGVPATTWYPSALFLTGLLSACAVGGRWRWSSLPVLTRVALGALAAYTAWSYLTILWADVPGSAWDGANRTLLYLVIFILFALPDARRIASALLGGWTLALIGLSLVVLLRLPAAIGPVAVVHGPGLTSPAGYTNAEAALWLMPVWPALVLCHRESVPWWLRAVFAAGAVLLINLAALTESRGAAFSTGIVALLFLLLLPDRVGHLLRLIVVAAGLALTLPHTLHVANTIEHDPSAVGRLGTVAEPALLAAGAVGLVVGALGAFEIYPPPRLWIRQLARGALASGAIASVLAGSVLLTASHGGPITVVKRGWHSFMSDPKPLTHASGHLAAGLGGARRDYYRVALHLFDRRPLTGIGVDNFQEEYLALGRSSETPQYTHSIELRTLVGTGLIGAVLLAVALIAATWLALQARRRAGRHEQAVAAGALLVFLYWLVHGSVDWFWETPALAGPAFAMLGLASALAPRPERSAPTGGPPGRQRVIPGRLLRRAYRVALGTAALLATVSLVLPWVASIELVHASTSWRQAPQAAMRQLRVAAALNPISAEPQLFEGTIALRLGWLGHARRAFERALKKDPRSAYATLELGAIASSLGRRRQALALLERAEALNPDDAVTQLALSHARAGRRIDISRLDDQLAVEARELG